MTIAESHNITELLKTYMGGQRNFRNANLSGLELKRAHLPEIDLQGAYLRWVDFQGANLKLANLAWADLQKANLSDSSLQQAMLKEANLRKANLQWADLQQAQLQGANLFHTHLICANFRGASLRLANLEGADLDKAELTGADLRIVNLISAQLRNADLKEAKLQEANLQYANLTGAHLEGVNLQGADLTGAKLFGANLQNANLKQANLEGVDLSEAKLFGANLTRANLERTLLPSLENMRGACFKQAKLVSTILPKGQCLDSAILENGFILESTNSVKTLPPSSETETSKLMPSGSDTPLSNKSPSSESRGDEVATRSRNSLTHQKSLKDSLTIDRSPELSYTEISQAPQPIFPNFEVQASPDVLEQTSPTSPNGDSNQVAIARQHRIPNTPNRNKKPNVNSQSPELLTIIKQRIGTEGHFTSTSLAIAKRRGPSQLRQTLLEAYDRCCAMTGCDVEPILEVAFLQPNLPEHKSDPSNGLLLRADIHTLFDLHLIAIDPETMNIMVAPSLRNDDSYGTLHGQTLRTTSIQDFKPNLDYLKLRLHWCGWLDDLA